MKPLKYAIEYNIYQDYMINQYSFHILIIILHCDDHEVIVMKDNVDGIFVEKVILEYEIFSLGFHWCWMVRLFPSKPVCHILCEKNIFSPIGEPSGYTCVDSSFETLFCILWVKVMNMSGDW